MQVEHQNKFKKMSEKFGRTEPYKEGEFEATPENREAKAEEMMTPAQKDLSQAREQHMEKHGLILQFDTKSYSRDVKGAHSTSEMPPEVASRWPEAYAAQRLTGKTQDGREIVLMGVLEGEGRHYMGTINGKEVPPEVARQLWEKHDKTPFRENPEKFAQAGREVDTEYAPAGNVAERELWEDLL